MEVTGLLQPVLGTSSFVLGSQLWSWQTLLLGLLPCLPGGSTGDLEHWESTLYPCTRSALTQHYPYTRSTLARALLLHTLCPCTRSAPLHLTLAQCSTLVYPILAHALPFHTLCSPTAWSQDFPSDPIFQEAFQKMYLYSFIVRALHICFSPHRSSPESPPQRHAGP